MLSQVIVFLNLFNAVQRNQGEERIYIYPPHQYHFPFICQTPLMPLSQLGPVRACTHDLWGRRMADPSGPLGCRVAGI